MRRQIFYFSLFHVILLNASFLLHYTLLKESIGIAPLIYSYLLSGGLSLSILIFIYLFRAKFKDKLGFVFMGCSLAKFAILIVVFKRIVLGEMVEFEKATFLLVFIPYALSLVSTTFAMTKIIANMEKETLP